MFNDLWNKFGLLLAAMAFVAGTSQPAFAQEKVLNLYSARHYQTDEGLYANFTKATGIKINRIEGGEDALMERIETKAPTVRRVLITVDVGRLWRAEAMGLFAPVKSKLLESASRPITAIRTATGSASRRAHASLPITKKRSSRRS